MPPSILRQFWCLDCLSPDNGGLVLSPVSYLRLTELTLSSVRLTLIVYSSLDVQEWLPLIQSSQ